MKFYIAILLCLTLSGCSRCWDEVCTLSCEQNAEQSGADPSMCSTDAQQDDTVEIGDIAVEDVEELVPSDAETLDDGDTVPTVEADVED